VAVFFTCHGTNARHPIRKPLNSSSNIFEHSHIKRGCSEIAGIAVSRDRWDALHKHASNCDKVFEARRHLYILNVIISLLGIVIALFENS